MSDLRTACLSANRGGTVAEGAVESDAADIVERALGILDEEACAWVTRRRDLAVESEGGPDA